MAATIRPYARSLFSELTQSTSVPLDPDELPHIPVLLQRGHVFFGDVPVRCYKHKGRWMYDERDIRTAGRELAGLAVVAGRRRRSGGAHVRRAAGARP